MWKEEGEDRGWGVGGGAGYNKGMARIHGGRGEESEEGNRGGVRERGRLRRKGDVTSMRQPMRVREGERERGRRRVCFSITAASAEERGTVIFIEKRKKSHKIDTETREEKAEAADRGKEHHSAGKSIFL